jgi:hypothetical protein
MERKSKLFKTLNCTIMVIMAITTVSLSPCFANSSTSPYSEMMVAFTESMDTELGVKVEFLLEEKDLVIDLENGVSATLLEGEITLVPLIPSDFHQMTTLKGSDQKSKFLAYINHENLGRFLVFLEVIKSQKDTMPSSIKMIFPSGRGLILNMNPFCIHQICASETEISLQDNDDLENTIIISDTCETLAIITTTFESLCVIYSQISAFCIIAAIAEAIYELLC